MRISTFSEFSYGHAVTSEWEKHLIQRRNERLIKAPDLPSLRKEAALGYDVRIDTNASVIALQFKLGEFISRRHPASPTWYLANNRPHYRIKFEPDDHQLEKMRILESKLNRLGKRAVVRYSAPAFHTARNFSDHYVADQVLANSYSCKPLQIQRDRDEHYLISVDGQTWLFSDPKDVSEYNLLKAVNELPILHESSGAGEDPSGAGESEKSVESADDVEGTATLDVLEKSLIDLVINTRVPDNAKPDVDRLRRSAADAFQESDQLQQASVVLEVAAALGIHMGISARYASSN